MTPRERAVRLVNKYLDEVINETDINLPLELPKRLAMIAVDEIIKCAIWKYNAIEHTIFWQEVKHEIEKL